MGDDAQKYVTRKMEILRHIDSGMAESRKVHELIRGLPYDIQIPMVSQTVATCDEFLRKLRQLSEAHYLSRERRTDSRRNYNSSYRNSTVTMAKFERKETTQQSSSEWRTKDGKPICFFCNKIGHVKKVCFAFKRQVEGQRGRNNRGNGRNNNNSRDTWNKNKARPNKNTVSNGHSSR